MPDTRRWRSIDDYFESIGQSWATISDIRPGDRYRSRRPRPVDEDQDQQPVDETATHKPR